MSGLAFQVLRGPGSQFQNLIDAANRSDLYKTAKEFAPNVNLIPVTKSWEISNNENAVNDLALGGLYFGKWVMNHNSQDRADNNNGKKRSEAFLQYGNEVVARTMVLISGDDIMAWNTVSTTHYGFATSLHLKKLEDDQQPQHGVQVSFIGYKISNNPDFVFPAPTVVISPNSSGNVSLTAQDLTAAGYTYQWNVQTGIGNFVDPNVPNAVFVPSGNGDYIVQLVVTDSEGYTSIPQQIPFTVNLASIEFKNDSATAIQLKHSNTGYVTEFAAGQTIVFYGTIGQGYSFEKVPFDHKTTSYINVLNHDGSSGNAVVMVDSFKFDTSSFGDNVERVTFDIQRADGGFNITNNFTGGNAILTGDFDKYTETVVSTETVHYFNRHDGHKIGIKHNLPFSVSSENGILGNSVETSPNIHYWESLDGFLGGANPGNLWQINPV